MPERTLHFVGSPDANPEVKSFWDAAAEGRFIVKRCTDCGQAHWHPRALCPFCFSQATEFVTGSGNGTIYAFSVMRRTESPYVIAYVTLDEGTTMMTNIVDCDFERLKIGQRVRLIFKPTVNGPPVPCFTTGA